MLLYLIGWGCSPSEEVVLRRNFPERVWIYPDTLWGSLSVKNPPACYKLELHLYLEESYPWRNLYLLFWIDTPEGFREQRKLYIPFTDSLGQWYEPHLHFRHIIGEQVHFGMKGTYKVGILPYVRQDTVPSIRRVELHTLPCPKRK